MKLRWLAVFGLVLGAGCFNPTVKDLGFACSLADVDPCPSGFQCINGLCDDGSGRHAPVAADLSVATASDMTQPQSQPDLAHAGTHDMAKAPPPPDMTLPPDMTPACAADGKDCTKSSDCCSGHCHSLTTLVCFG